MPSPPRYTHGHAESVLRSHRTRTVENSAAYLAPFLQSGQTLLDVGSGPGTITVDLAARVSPGRVTALETSEQALRHTMTEARSRGIDTIDFVVGDVQALDIQDASYDVVHAHQVLQHVPDPVAAISEMVRVCRPAGIVAARDGDYSGFTWYPASEGLDRWLALYKAVARHNGGEPDAGRRLLAWAHEAGCSDVIATSSTWCYADPMSRQEWGGTWAERIVSSAIADHLVDSDLASREDLAELAQAWRTWAAEPDAWISILHGEIVIRVE